MHLARLGKVAGGEPALGLGELGGELAGAAFGGFVRRLRVANLARQLLQRRVGRVEARRFGERRQRLRILAGARQLARRLRQRRRLRRARGALLLLGAARVLLALTLFLGQAAGRFFALGARRGLGLGAALRGFGAHRGEGPRHVVVRRREAFEPGDGAVETAGVRVAPGRLDLRLRRALVLLAGQPRVLLGLAPPGGLRLQAPTLGLRGEALALGFGGLALLLLFLFDGALRPPPDVERLRLVRLDAQRRVAPDDRRAELARVELDDGFAEQRGRLGAAPRRRFGLLPRQLDLGAQVLEHARIGAVAGRLVGVRLRLFEGAVHDGAAGAFDGVADPFLPRPFPGRLLFDRGLGAMADLPGFVEAGLVELGFGRGPDRPGPVLALERGARPLHHGGERHLVAGAGDRLAQHADAGVAGPYLDGLGDERVGGLDVAAAEGRLGVGQVLVGVLLVERRLRLGPQLVRPALVLVDGAGAIAVLDRLFVAAGRRTPWPPRPCAGRSAPCGCDRGRCPCPAVASAGACPPACAARAWRRPARGACARPTPIRRAPGGGGPGSGRGASPADRDSAGPDPSPAPC